MSTIALNRQFLEWQEGGLSDPDLFRRFGRTDDLLTWEAISARRRVVILAEAGSGKSTEMREQARLRTEAGQFAVYATVEDVGRDTLWGALGLADQTRLTSWRESQESGWFFVDSIDEAKLSGVRLERTIRRLGEGIAGAERRAHVILSGRITDWEFRRDLKRLNEGLPVPDDPVLPPPPTADQLLISALRHQRRRRGVEETPQKEQALVILMATLDPGRVRLFAAAKGAPNLDDFLARFSGAIEAANLWPFAGRPLDLDWLVKFWQRHGRLGSLEEMLENSLTKRIGEADPARARGDELDETRALHALERIGASLVFGRKTTIAIPDSELELSKEERPLDLAQVLPDWSGAERMRLLSRPVFDPATFGRIRLHSDNEAVVRAYLTARWLRRLRQNNLSHGELFELLFATSYGIELIKPSMQETAAWLAIWDEDVGREVARRAPFLLLTAGDPARLPTIVREAVLTDVIEQIAAKRLRLPILDHDRVKRFVQPDLAQTIQRLWIKHNGDVEARERLLWLIWLGQLKDCADLAEVAFYSHEDRRTRIVAGRSIASAGDDAMKRRYWEYIKAHSATLPNALIINAIDDLFPKFVSVRDFLDIFGLCSMMPMFASAQSFIQVPGKLTSIYVGGTPIEADAVWGINSAQNIFVFDGMVFRNIPGNLSQIAVDGNAVWDINSSNNVFIFDPEQGMFVQIAGALTQIAAHGGTTWGINADQNVFIYDGTAFVQVPGKLTQIAVDGASVWGINPSQNVYVFDGAQRKFVQIPGSLTAIAVGGGGAEVWGINANQDIFRFDYGAQAFVNVPGKLTSIAVGGPSFGTIGVWGINAANNVYAFNDTAFVQVPGQLTQISVFGGAVWGVNSNQDIFRFEFCTSC